MESTHYFGIRFDGQLARFSMPVRDAEFQALTKRGLPVNWVEAPAAIAPKPKTSIVEQRAAKVEAKLKEWEGKQKRAAAKVKAYRAKSRYYAKKLSAADVFK